MALVVGDELVFCPFIWPENDLFLTCLIFYYEMSRMEVKMDVPVILLDLNLGEP